MAWLPNLTLHSMELVTEFLNHGHCIFLAGEIPGTLLWALDEDLHAHWSAQSRAHSPRCA